MPQCLTNLTATAYAMLASHRYDRTPARILGRYAEVFRKRQTLVKSCHDLPNLGPLLSNLGQPRPN